MKKLQIITLAIILSMGVGFTTSKVCSQPELLAASVSAPSAPQVQYTDVNPLDVVANPYKFLKKNIRMKGKFDKFSTLGLDYPAAMRSHEDYISFMIQRPDVTNHNIPLSELKLFLKKEVAEKHIDLDAGDEIVISGKVFSNAIGDAWVDIHDLKVTNKVNKKETKK